MRLCASAPLRFRSLRYQWWLTGILPQIIQRGMQEEQPEIGRFKPKGDNPKEPREPFYPDEMLGPEEIAESPSLKNLHPPKGELSKEKLSVFLVELKPIVSGIQEMSRSDQHHVAEVLSAVKNQIHASGLSDEVIHLFEKVVDHFNELLIHSRPVDQDAVLSTIELIVSKL